jgi:3-methylfumaryl-CoA hydratase
VETGKDLPREDICAGQSVRRVAAMLDLDPGQFPEGSPLPRGWHFFLLGGDTRRSQLRADGFPGFGLPMPDLGLPRLLLGGRTVAYSGDIVIGTRVERLSKVLRLERKQGPNGPSVIVTLQHALRPLPQVEAAIVETQTYILLPDGKGAGAASAGSPEPPSASAKTVTPDETMLFQYSALGFNSHKIHLDRAHARDVEGMPDLVVNGGLATLLATEFLRTEMGVVPVQMKTRHTAPLFCGRPITFMPLRDGQTVTLKALDPEGTLAMTMEMVAA